MSEQVLVIDSWRAAFEGFADAPKRCEDMLMLDIVNFGIFMDRAAAEEDTKYRQIIPYTVITCGDKIFVTVRTKAHAEPRLASKVSVGIGGHINECVIAGDSSIANNAFRELVEELVIIPENIGIEHKGYIAMNETAVDKVHLGVVYQLKVENPADIRINHSEHATGDWFYMHEAAQQSNLEPWSALLLKERKQWE